MGSPCHGEIGATGDQSMPSVDHRTFLITGKESADHFSYGKDLQDPENSYYFWQKHREEARA
jgi:hypothetical protein